MNQKGGIELLILVIVIIVSFLLTGGFTVYQNSTTPQDSTNQTVELVEGSPQPSHQTLQLQTLTFTTTPSMTCGVDNSQPMSAGCSCSETTLITLKCKNFQCESMNGLGFSGICDPLMNWCAGLGNGTYCVDKPVIYLYPLKDTTVNVTLNIPGSIVESIPTYINGGWTVLAHPNGSLEYLGKTYPELYYESSVTKVNPPKQGFVVEKGQAEEKLKEITTKLGLIKIEQDEFLSYWLPKINKLNAPYLFISVIDNEEKNRIDKVVILPKPDTKIEFLVYFKPVYAPFSPQELKLPDQPPKRNGFTAVEWGGTIDTN